jgi:branched-chain amino acid transport system permease protein
MKAELASRRAVVASRPRRTSDTGDLKVLGVCLVLAGAMPFVLGPYGLRVATSLCMYLALAQAWNLVGGYAGLISLAHPAFFGTGAVGAAVFLINGFGVPVAAAGALVLSLCVAAVTGLPTLRLRGHYFVVATLLVSEALRNLVLNLHAFGFNGAISVNLLGYIGSANLDPSQYNTVFYFAMLLWAAVGMGLVIGLERSRWGYGLKALRDSQGAAEALGVATTRLKVGVFLLSAALTSVVGTTWALWLGTVETNAAYNLLLTFEVIVMVFLGGRGSVWGPITGVAIVLLVNELVGTEFPELTQIIAGVIVVIIVLFQPDGLITVLREGPGAFAPRRLWSNLARYKAR